MKKILLALLAVPLWGAYPVLVHNTPCNSDVNIHMVCDLSTNTPTAGNFLIVGIGQLTNPPALVSITDNLSHTYTLDAATVCTSSCGGSFMYHLIATAGITSITVDQNPHTNQMIAQVLEFSGITGVDVMDTVGRDDHTTDCVLTAGALAVSCWKTQDITTTNAHDILVAFVWSADSAGSPWGEVPPYKQIGTNDSTSISAVTAFNTVSQIGTYEIKGLYNQAQAMGGSYTYTAPAPAVQCQPIVIQASKVPADIADYILTVNDTATNLEMVSTNGRFSSTSGLVQSFEGNDITWWANSNRTGPLSWDPLEYWDPSTGLLITHVRVGAISHTTNTTIYRCAGDSSVTTFQGGSRGAAWPSTYKGVYHFGQIVDHAVSAFPSLLDSTAAAADINTVPVIVAQPSGQIDGGFGNPTIGTHPANVPTFTGLSGSVTVMMWEKSTTNSDFQRYWGTDISAVTCDPSNMLQFVWNYPDVVLSTSTNVVDGNPHMLVGVYNSSGSASVYSDGVLAGTTSAPTTFTAFTTFNIGSLGGGSNPANGSMDEFRIMNFAMPANDVTTYFNNQSSPATFYTPGSWTPIGGTQTRSRIIIQ